MKHKDKPAFPFNPKRAWDNESDQGYLGLTKREYFAGLAMQGLLGNSTIVNPEVNNSKIIVECSLLLADELLKQLDLE